MTYRITIEVDSALTEGSYKWKEIYQQEVENIDVPALVTIINETKP